MGWCSNIELGREGPLACCWFICACISSNCVRMREFSRRVWPSDFSSELIYSIARVSVSHLLDLLFWLCGRRMRRASKQSFISLRRLRSASLCVTRNSGVRLYGVLPAPMSASSIRSRTCLCCSEWWCTLCGNSKIHEYGVRQKKPPIVKHTVLSPRHPRLGVHAAERLRRTAFPREGRVGFFGGRDRAGSCHVGIRKGVRHTCRGCLCIVDL